MVPQSRLFSVWKGPLYLFINEAQRRIQLTHGEEKLPLAEASMLPLALLDQISRDAGNAWLKPPATLINVDQAEKEKNNANLNVCGPRTEKAW